MIKEELLQIALNPKLISKEEIISLERILKEYPYFQTVQVLHLKGLKQQRSFRYNKMLKQVAAYTTNRTVLFDFITADALDYKEKIKQESVFLNDLDVESVEIVEPNIVKHIKDSINTQKEVISKSKEDTLEQVSRKLSLGLPINFDENDEFSFNEWLNLPSIKPIKRSKTSKKQDYLLENIKKNSKSKISEQVNLIEKFITKRPKIITDKNQIIKDIATESVVENTNLMTETLARVYVEQKKYDKAIEAFNILCLKYPEKSSSFADKIKAIQILQKNKS